ncbi:serine hydrolase domain-containing protein [Kiloniella sp.]|uniref:serine hydrolase domain-containing protein n=1 Tax=Kiloniella sp. TaxID=1938587 RepID=UPI003B01FA9E
MEFQNNAARLGFDADRLGRIDQWMQRYVDENKFPGASVMIAKRGEIAHFSTVGLRSIEQNTPYERDTIVRIYSMTKPITTLALMMLMERGLFHLDTTIDRFLPEFATCTTLVEGATSIEQTTPCPPPTIHQILTHTSGLSYSFNEGLLAEAYARQKLDFGPGSDTLEQRVKRLAQIPLAFAPGSRWEYSVGIDIIGRLIEVLSGQPLDQFLQEQIFTPLVMTDTGFTVPENKQSRFAGCYLYTNDNPLTPMDPGLSDRYQPGQNTIFSGGGGLVSTLDDYLKFAEMIRLGGTLNGHKLVSSKTVDFMRSNHLPGDIASMGPSSFAETPMDGVGFGLGGSVVLDPARQRTPGSIGDFGWGGMASTFWWMDPVKQMNVIFFTQLVPSSTYSNRPELKALVHAALL